MLNGILVYNYCSWTADRDSHQYLPQSATDYGNGTLIINSLTEQDGRLKFCCDASNEHGQQCNCINLNVLSKFQYVFQLDFVCQYNVSLCSL